MRRRGWSGPLRFNPGARKSPGRSFSLFRQGTFEGWTGLGERLCRRPAIQSALLVYDLPEFLKAQNVPTREPVDFTAHVLSAL